MPGTRLRVLSMFMEWARSDPMRIFWLAGLAGTGKTSIAITLCRMLQADSGVLLGGAFFCSRIANINDQMDARCILPTLAVSLAERWPGFATSLAQVLNADSRAALKPIGLQIASLLQQPMTGANAPYCPIVFVIDALDECSDENEVKKLLQAISIVECGVTVKFILTSRPETHISTSPISRSDFNSILKLHTIDTAEVTEDIRLYINGAFSRQLLNETWYTESDLLGLARRSEGLFIFASTIITYVLGTRSPSWRAARLRRILSAVNSAAAIGPLDAMYDLVMTRAGSDHETDVEELEETKHVLACILAARVPLSIRALAELLDRKPNELCESLERLHSVVHVPDQYDQPGLRTLHASFGDYLLQRAADRVRISRALGDDSLARGCIQLMQKRLHFDVSQSCSSYEANQPSTLNSITLSLKYACMQWVYHIEKLPHTSMLDSVIYNSFRPQFLFWLEMMSVLDQVQRAAAMLIIAIETVGHRCSYIRVSRSCAFYSLSRWSSLDFFVMPTHSWLRPKKQSSRARHTSTYRRCRLRPKTLWYTPHSLRCARVSPWSIRLVLIATVNGRF